jgi:hypothetical protein
MTISKKARKHLNFMIICIFRSNQTWSSPDDTPVCTPVECPEPSEHDVICPNGFAFNSKCEVTCWQRYEKTDVVMTCQSDKTWTQPCKKIKCPLLVVPKNQEKWECTDANNLESVCRPKCREGFQSPLKASATVRQTLLRNKITN